MRRSQRGYSSYRGRRTLTDVLKIVAAVLGVLAVVLLVAVWIGGKDGLPLKLPDVSQQDGGQSDVSGDGQGDDQSGGTGSESGQEEPDTSQPEQPEEPEQESVMTALELPISAILDGTAAAQLEQAGANALVLTMKDEEGLLAWNSQQALAQSYGVNAGDETVQQQLQAWNQGEVYTVARVCCFRDNTIPYHRNDLAMRASYGNWRDEKGLRWLNPASEGAREYLAGLCGELAAMGFDEILLECAGFPTAGSVDRITSGAGEQAQAVSAFVELAEQAVAPYGTKISLRAEAGVLTGELPECGITTALLSGLEGRIWMVSGTEPAPQALLTQAGVTDGEGRLVEIVPQLEQDSAVPQAKLLDETT